MSNRKKMPRPKQNKTKLKKKKDKSRETLMHCGDCRIQQCCGFSQARLRSSSDGWISLIRGFENLSFASSLICDSLLTQQEPVWMFMNLLTSPQLEWNLCSIRLSEIWDAKTKWASSCSRTHCSPTCSPSVCTVSWTTVIRQKSVLLRQRSQQGESYEFTFVLFVSEIFLWEMRVKAFKMWGRFVLWSWSRLYSLCWSSVSLLPHAVMRRK